LIYYATAYTLHRRFDFVEVDLANVNGVAYAAQLMYFICYKDKLQYAVVRYFHHFAKIEPNLGVYVCREDDVDASRSYGVVPVKSIVCHAHLIPDLDALEASADGSRWVVPPNCDYFWDKVQDGRISRSLSGAVELSSGGELPFLPDEQFGEKHGGKLCAALPLLGMIVDIHALWSHYLF
jgi:hypothetical protein